MIGKLKIKNPGPQTRLSYNRDLYTDYQGLNFGQLCFIDREFSLFCARIIERIQRRR